MQHANGNFLYPSYKSTTQIEHTPMKFYVTLLPF